MIPEFKDVKVLEVYPIIEFVTKTGIYKLSIRLIEFPVVAIHIYLDHNNKRIATGEMGLVNTHVPFEERWELFVTGMRRQFEKIEIGGVMEKTELEIAWDRIRDIVWSLQDNHIEFEIDEL